MLGADCATFAYLVFARHIESACVHVTLSQTILINSRMHVTFWRSYGHHPLPAFDSPTIVFIVSFCSRRALSNCEIVMAAPLSSIDMSCVIGRTLLTLRFPSGLTGFIARGHRCRTCVDRQQALPTLLSPKYSFRWFYNRLCVQVGRVFYFRPTF